MKQENLTEQAYQIIKEKIISGEWKFGYQIDQKSVTSELGFRSVTPIREALIKLQNEKMVNILPRIGIVVSEISLEDVMENFQIRQIIELPVLRETVSQISSETVAAYREIFQRMLENLDTFDMLDYLKLDMQFHLDLLRPIGNHTLDRIMRKVYEQNTRYRMACIKIRPAKDMLDEHMAILDAIEQQNAEAAVYALRFHIQNSRDTLANRFQF